MTLKDRIARGETTAHDAEHYGRERDFTLGILRRAAVLLMLFFVVGLGVGAAFGYFLP